jgi:histidine triad (HIT) family protein
MEQDCLFCKIVNREIPAKIFYEDDRLLAFYDIEPAAPVHILLIPKKHIANILAATEADQDLLKHILVTVPKLAKQAGIDEAGFRTVINTKDNGGQTVHHMHLHILGGRFMTWPPG